MKWKTELYILAPMCRIFYLQILDQQQQVKQATLYYSSYKWIAEFQAIKLLNSVGLTITEDQKKFQKTIIVSL